jgi:hypothetical protein
MEKRYQVFVSSTYEDLREERQEVIQALLELDCIPSGMELFPAADEDQWSLIKKVIDDCDYYLVIIGGRYGSLSVDGKSYTQMEYEYALSNGKPIVAFLHAEPGKIESGRTEKSEDGRKKLEAFREIAKKKMVRNFSSPKDLGSVVSRSIIQLIKTKAGIGWVRSNETVDGRGAQEILRLREQIERMEKELQNVATTTPPGSENLVQGAEKHSFQFEMGFQQNDKSWSGNINATLSWDQVFYDISPRLDEGNASDEEIVNTLVHATRFIVPGLVEQAHKGATNIEITGLTRTSLQTILTQFKALGLISRNEASKTSGRSWKLTHLGESKMNALFAIPSKVNSKPKAGVPTAKKAGSKKAPSKPGAPL